MILPDVNLLIHAYNSESPVHRAARAWWEELLNGTRPVGLAWAAILGFVRISTHRQILERPFPVGIACETLGSAGNLTTDAHLAALAIEHQAELHSTDRDFGRFAGLRWINPIA